MLDLEAFLPSGSVLEINFRDMLPDGCPSRGIGVRSPVDAGPHLVRAGVYGRVVVLRDGGLDIEPDFFGPDDLSAGTRIEFDGLQGRIAYVGNVAPWTVIGEVGNSDVLKISVQQGLSIEKCWQGKDYKSPDATHFVDPKTYRWDLLSWLGTKVGRTWYLKEQDGSRTLEQRVEFSGSGLGSNVRLYEWEKAPILSGKKEQKKWILWEGEISRHSSEKTVYVNFGEGHGRFEVTPDGGGSKPFSRPGKIDSFRVLSKNQIAFQSKILGSHNPIPPPPF